MDKIRLGLKENWKQFTLLVIVNGFVGGMLGMERTILPQLAEKEFGIAATTAILSFIVVFGVVKAITNYYTGFLANRFGRRRLLIAGWLLALPVPFILIYAPNWNWIIAANILLGVQQGLTWSSTVVMKIDLVGEKKRGLAMGLNEFAGYLSVAAIAFLTGWIAAHYGLRPYPFYTGIFLSVLGLLVSIFFIRDTKHHVQKESLGHTGARMKNIFWNTSWKDKNLGSVSQAGLVNNMNDGMLWGLLPIILISKGFGLTETGLLSALYPAVWGVGQLFTGALADRICKKKLLFIGMLSQGIALTGLVWADSRWEFIAIAVILGAGTALVYPTFMAAVAEHTHPADRAQSLGIFRFWRDLGYAIGAVLTGILADALGIHAAVIFISALTVLSAWIIRKRMQCNNNVKMGKCKNLKMGVSV